MFLLGVLQSNPNPATTDVSKRCAPCRKSPNLAIGQHCAQACLPNWKSCVGHVSTDRGVLWTASAIKVSAIRKERPSLSDGRLCVNNWNARPNPCSHQGCATIKRQRNFARGRCIPDQTSTSAQHRTRLLTTAAHNTRSQRSGHVRTSVDHRLLHTSRHNPLLALSTNKTAATMHRSTAERPRLTAKHSDPAWSPGLSQSLELSSQWVADTCRPRRSWIFGRTRDSNGTRRASWTDTVGVLPCLPRQRTVTEEAALDTTTKQYHLAPTTRSLPMRTKSRMAAAHAVCRGRMQV